MDHIDLVRRIATKMPCPWKVDELESEGYVALWGAALRAGRFGVLNFRAFAARHIRFRLMTFLQSEMRHDRLCGRRGTPRARVELAEYEHPLIFPDFAAAADIRRKLRVIN